MTLDTTTKARLRNFIERIERVDEERKALTTDIGDIYKQAKGEGFDVKVMREIVKRRKKDPAAQATHDELVEVYMRAVDTQMDMFEREPA